MAEKIVNVKELSKRIGIDTVLCPCGAKIDATLAITQFFMAILNICGNGERVHIKNFGSFYTRVQKAGRVKSTALIKGEAEIKEHLILTFSQARGAKKILNKGKI